MEVFPTKGPIGFQKLSELCPDVDPRTLENLQLFGGYRVSKILGMMGNALALRVGHREAPITLVWETKKGSNMPLITASPAPFWKKTWPIRFLRNERTHIEPYGPQIKTSIGPVIKIKTGDSYLTPYFIPSLSFCELDQPRNKNNQDTYENLYSLYYLDNGCLEGGEIYDFKAGEETHFFGQKGVGHGLKNKVTAIIGNTPHCNPKGIIEKLHNLKG